MLAEKLLRAQNKALRRLLALAMVFELPVPPEAVQAVAGDVPVEPALSRAVSLGLMESGVDPVERSRRYFVSGILEPLLAGEISDAERQGAYRAAARWVKGVHGGQLGIFVVKPKGMAEFVEGDRFQIS